jgi:CubicO group peptidase (beta-lactamase class C family)
MANGRLSDGTEVLPSEWMKESTAPSKAYEGYGYFWWLDSKDVFSTSGIFGQGIRVDRSENLVIALHSARHAASEDSDWAWDSAMFEVIPEATR